MKRISAFRAASVLLAVFCVLHTAGGMLAQKSLGAESDAVFAAMKRVHFDFNGSDATWYGFWFGFGLTTSLFLAFSALVAWELERVPAPAWASAHVIAWALVASHLCNTLLAWKYFFAGPGTFGVVITALLAAGTLRKNREHTSRIQSVSTPLQ